MTPTHELITYTYIDETIDEAVAEINKDGVAGYVLAIGPGTADREWIVVLRVPAGDMAEVRTRLRLNGGGETSEKRPSYTTDVTDEMTEAALSVLARYGYSLLRVSGPLKSAVREAISAALAVNNRPPERASSSTMVNLGGSIWTSEHRPSEPVPPPFSDCRGSYALGSACGHCERCAQERAEMRAAARGPLTIASGGSSMPRGNDGMRPVPGGLRR